jgi:hypothetical protein
MRLMRLAPDDRLLSDQGPPEKAEHRPIDPTIQFGKPTAGHNPTSWISPHN